MGKRSNPQRQVSVLVPDWYREALERAAENRCTSSSNYLREAGFERMKSDGVRLSQAGTNVPNEGTNVPLTTQPAAQVA